MVRKSKQAGGNFPLTHYERTKKFASSEYGTTAKRLAGHSQYQFGDCGLSLTRLSSTAVVCSPSGYLYAHDAILEYLLTKTQDIKQQQTAWEAQQASEAKEAATAAAAAKQGAFESSQRILGKRQRVDEVSAAKADLKRTSYWLAEAQPQAAASTIEQPPERPASPHSQQPLRRKELWPLDLQWEDDEKVKCAVSGKTIHTQAATAYWIDKKKPGTVLLKSVYDELVQGNRCPLTSKKIKEKRQLQQGGTSFAASGQAVQVKKYRPTIT